MDAIRIPSPSAILDPPHPHTTTKPKSTPQQSRPNPARRPSLDATPRPKQSKSRNGCTTCKAKRLKCDETKPSCQQCQRRNVTCGGYKKDFKWRSFEEIMAVKTLPSKRASPPPETASQGRSSSPLRKAARRTSAPALPETSLAAKEFQLSPTSSSFPDEISLSDAFLGTSVAPLSSRTHATTLGKDSGNPFNVPTISESPEIELAGFMLSDPELDSLSHSLPVGLEHPDIGLADDEPSFSSMLEDEADEYEAIVRQSEASLQLWPVQDFPPSSVHLNAASDFSTMTTLLQQPAHSPGSEEWLISRFNRWTCGILSVKDGLSENPWRTYILPQAKDCPALWHAVFAMAAFHASKDNPTMRVAGMEHMRKSINYMVQGMVQMQTDAALATTLSLAFAESWDQHTSTGILHLKGAKALMRQTLRNRMQRRASIEEPARLQFLYNTWLYMDVIARLTSMDEGDREELGSVPFAFPADGIHDVDPLMGCATTLFPLIGRVANLIQRVRRSDKNSFVVISQARELKNEIDQWDLPSHFNPPEDPHSELQDCIQTAYAYRSAVLLYLHQAVPEIPSPSSTVLADKTLRLLATVPLASRTNIVHIFPLLAASCEFENEEDRDWIMDRWKTMQNRLKIGNIDRCVDVIREVWRRRDSAKASREQKPRETPGSRQESTLRDSFQPRPMYGSMLHDGQDAFYSEAMPTISMRKKAVSTVSTVEELEIEQTVRGSHHWVGVMKDWHWEVLLG